MDKNSSVSNIWKQIDSNCINFMRSLNNQISRNIKNDIETRPVKSNGLWCCLLIPIILVLYSLCYAVSPLYKLTACLSVGLLCYSVLFIIFITVSDLILRNTTFAGCIASIFVSALLIYTLVMEDIMIAMAYSILCVLSYSYILRACIVNCPKTFTFGEAMIVVQAFVLFVIMAVAQILQGNPDEDRKLINAVVFTVLSTVGLIVTVLYHLKEQQRELKTLGLIVISAAVFVIAVLHSVLGYTTMRKIIMYIFGDEKRCYLIGFWLCLLILAVLLIVVRTRMKVKASTVTRKSFHVLAALVFLSGIVFDVDFMRLAAGIVLGLLIFVEALRKSKIEPISQFLQSAFVVYSDEKDCGSFALTPIYLYAGLACPLVLVPARAHAALELLSGVLATGVGDTAASWFGERYGTTKWPDGNRTYEGTIFNIISQIGVVYGLILFELLDSKNALLRTAVAATISGLVEARTEQVDNLVLPLVTIIAFQSTWFLA